MSAAAAAAVAVFFVVFVVVTGLPVLAVLAVRCESSGSVFFTEVAVFGTTFLDPLDLADVVAPDDDATFLTDAGVFL